jgi:hypothetical protein
MAGRMLFMLPMVRPELMNTKLPFCLVLARALLALSGISPVSSLIRVPSMSKNNAFLLMIP